MKNNKDRVLTREEIELLPEREKMKYEIAEELGLYEKVLQGGWKCLTSREAGRIGGMMTRRRKEMQKDMFD